MKEMPPNLQGGGVGLGGVGWGVGWGGGGGINVYFHAYNGRLPVKDCSIAEIQV